ncbi:MAG: RNA ligase family protein [Limnohabitans sp.]|nr:RNA ligase family protein [Limnohabitans sp.]
MEFRKYNSIENTYQKTVLEQIIKHEFEKNEYVVQEKVHGANFAFYTNGIQVKIAKRSDFIEENDTFYNAQKVAEKYHTKVKSLFYEVKELFPNVQFITVFGELFGGHYNHPEVPTVQGAIKVQKGIDYSPENDFYAFDIKVDNSHYMNVELANKLFEKTGFFYAKTLFKGSLTDCLKYPNDFNSLIPEWLGLPALETNIVEGVIIRPVETLFFGNGSRVLLKNKNERWAERGKNDKPKREHQEVEFPPEAQSVWSKIKDYVTVNRLYNVLSKEGEFHPKIFGKLTGWMSQDVVTDFKKDYPTELDTLEKENQKAINKRLNTLIVNTIKEEFMTFKV